MRILIVYGTTEGHTRALAEFAARTLRDDGHAVTLEAAGEGRSDPEAFDAAILAASLHVGRYQAPLVEFARAHHEALNGRPSAFISVSLSAAGVNPHDWQGLEDCLARLEHETQWTPDAVHQAAGAIRYSSYDFFKSLVIHFIAARRGEKTRRSRDYDLTDYEALKAFVLEFAASDERRDREMPGSRRPGTPDRAAG